MLRLDDLFITYGDEKYAELGVFLDLLRALQLLHQTCHWQTEGHTFYEDHLLFQRLYEGIGPQVDSVGERAVGLGSSSLVRSRHFFQNGPKFILAVDEALDSPMGLQESTAAKLMKKALLAEKSFLTAGEKLMDTLKSKGLLTRGLEQLLGTVLDEHETSIYLLKQRSSGS